MHGKDDHLVDHVETADDAAEPRLLDVRLTVDGRDDIRTRLVRDGKRRRVRSARRGASRPPSRRRPCRSAPGRPRPRACDGSDDPGRRAATRGGRSRSGCAPRASRDRRCGVPPRRERAESTRPLPLARPRASSSCRRRRARCRATRRRFARRSRAASARRRRCVDPGGTAARRDRAGRRTPARACGTSAAPCAGRPRRCPRRAGQRRAAQP